MLKNILVAALIAEASLSAHTGVGLTSGFMAGFFHPVHGVDHILAMLAVGIWAAQLGGKALWSVPLSFVVMMLFGSFLGVQGVLVPFIEEGILASVLLLGLFIAFRVKVAVLLSSVSVGLFAIFHGYAHGSEMPLNMDGVEYGIGFLIATTLLHIVGIVVGRLIYQKTLFKRTLKSRYV